MTLDSPEAEMLLAHLPADERDDHWHLVLPDGTDLTTGEAGCVLLETLRPTRYLGRFLRRLRLQGVVALIDWVLDKARGRLGRLVAAAPGPRRYP